MLRLNQKKAINISINNNFQSGIHFHATGTGKSWIALHIILEYQTRYPQNNILWLCEKKDILIQQFDKNTLQEKGFSNLSKIFHILNYANYKNEKWINSVNASKFWNKPLLLIINRCYLTL